MRQLFRRGRSKIGARLFSILSMQSRKTKKRKRPTLEKKMQEWRRGGGEGKGGEDIYRVA